MFSYVRSGLTQVSDLERGLTRHCQACLRPLSVEGRDLAPRIATTRSQPGQRQVEPVGTDRLMATRYLAVNKSALQDGPSGKCTFKVVAVTRALGYLFQVRKQAGLTRDL